MTSTAGYDEAFYRAMGTGPTDAQLTILQTAFELVKPASVVDIGCGTGKWVAAARLLGVADSVGVDGAHVPHEQRIIPPDSFIERDLEASALDLGRRFDLVVCLEVAEHLSRPRSESFVAELCHLADVVLFSAAPPFQGGTHHVNEQWLEYWGILFRRHDYVPVDAIRDRIWSTSNIDWYYRQNVIFFCKRSLAEGKFPAEQILERRPLTRIHPLMFLVVVCKFWPFMYGKAYFEEARHHDLLLAAWLSGATELPAPGHRPSAAVDSIDAVSAAVVLHGNEDGALNNRVHVEQPLAFELDPLRGLTIKRG